MIEKINGLKHKSNKQKTPQEETQSWQFFHFFFKKMVSSAVEVLVDCDKERHDALGVWDLHGEHVVNVKHARNTGIPNDDVMGGRGWRLVT